MPTTQRMARLYMSRRLEHTRKQVQKGQVDTMKSEIKSLLKSECDGYRLNNISCLIRWTKDACGDPVDGLRLCFDNINGVNFGDFVDIGSRTYEGVIKECEAATNDFLNEVARRLTNDLRAGYRAN